MIKISPLIRSRKRNQGILDKMGALIRGIDQFGHPVSLTYKENSKYRSSLGGFITILCYFAILGYFLYLFS